MKAKYSKNTTNLRAHLTCHHSKIDVDDSAWLPAVAYLFTLIHVMFNLNNS